MPIYAGDKVATDPSTITGIEFTDQLGMNHDTMMLVDTEASVVDITRRSRLKQFLLNLGAL